MRKSALLLFGLVVAALVALGLVVLASAGEANAVRLHHDPYYFLKRQFAYLGAGLAVFAATAWFDYRKWRERWGLAAAFYVVVFALLVAVFAFRKINGSYRWIPIGPVNLQPSELAKLAVVVVSAVWMDRAGWRVELFRRGALMPMLLVAGLAAPVLKEPDLGGAMVIGAAGTLVVFVAGGRFLHLVPLGLAGAAAFTATLLANENRMRRIMPWIASVFGGGARETGQAVAKAISSLDPAAYQSHMSRVALQNGGIWGVGLGESMQKHAYLPEAHTDFIFAVGAEELGLFFTIATVALFVAFFALSLYVARKATDRFGRFLAFGMAFIVFFQAMFSFGVVSEALPTKGMALPFFSYGGTNLVSAFFAAGTILSVGIHSFNDRKRSLARGTVPAER